MRLEVGGKGGGRAGEGRGREGGGERGWKALNDLPRSGSGDGRGPFGARRLSGPSCFARRRFECCFNVCFDVLASMFASTFTSMFCLDAASGRCFWALLLDVCVDFAFDVAFFSRVFRAGEYLVAVERGGARSSGQCVARREYQDGASLSHSTQVTQLKSVSHDSSAGYEYTRGALSRFSPLWVSAQDSYEYADLSVTRNVFAPSIVTRGILPR